MGVKDDIWCHPTFREWHVLHRPSLAADTLLTMAAGELVPNYWIPLFS